MPLKSKIHKAIPKATAPSPMATRARTAIKTAKENPVIGTEQSTASGKTEPARAAAEPATENPQRPLASIIKARRIIFGVGVFGIAIFGSIYGAGLKIRGDTKAFKEEWESSSPEVQIMQLQAVRKKYEGMAAELRAKLKIVEDRIDEKSEESDGSQAGSSP